jgi:PAS domain S-box-containing protein
MKTIRSKIFFGILFLFAIIIALSVIGIIFINQLAQSSRGTIVDNYRTIDYTTKMLASLNEMYNPLRELNNSAQDLPLKSEFYKYKDNFEKYLELESANITETGESQLVAELHSGYDSFINSVIREKSGLALHDTLALNYNYVKSVINKIYTLNMEAVLAKNSEAAEKSRQVTYYTLIIGGISVILTMFFILTFPARIVKPIKNLTQKIKAISQRDYNQRIEINSDDEIGQLASAFNVMADRLKEYETRQIGEILTAKQRLEALVQNMQDGILVLDNSNNIVLANQVLAELSGIKVEELQGRNATEIALKNDLLRNILSGIFEEKKSEGNNKNTIRIIKDKTEYFYEPETIKIATESDNSPSRNMGNMIILKNVTWFEERDVAKTRMISTVSHEMKTPISSINLTIKLLEDNRVGQLNNEQKELVQAIREQSNRLSKVVNEILNYSQIETGNIRLNFSDVRPDDIIDYATTALMMLFSEKNIQLETEIENNLPSLKIDIEKTVWVLVNLLSNAIRYSNQGGEIKLSAGRDNDRVFFSVKDHGPGISEEDQKKLFSRFTQLGQKSERGWGLGLAISREFVQAQGGTIKVESSIGQGSTFYFYLPAQ